MREVESTSNLEIYEHTGEGYLSLVSFLAWRVAILRYNDRFARLTGLERHIGSDEVFVLLNGTAHLYVEDEKSELREIQMDPNKVYNVAKNVWHHIVVSPDANILIVENSNVCEANTERKTC